MDLSLFTSALYIVPADARTMQLLVVCVYNSLQCIHCHHNCPMNLPLQVQAGPLPDYNAQLHNDSAKQVEPAQTEAQAKVIITKLTQQSFIKHDE